MSELSEWITTEEAAELTGYRVEWIRWLARMGKIDKKKFGHAVMIGRESLLEYKEEQDKERERNRR